MIAVVAKSVLHKQRRLLTFFTWLVWSICVLGVFIFFSGQFLDRRNGHELRNAASVPPSIEANQMPSFDIELSCGVPPPGEESELARLFEFAESNEGEITQVKIAFYPEDCSCPDSQVGALVLLGRACEHNPKWWLTERMKHYDCVQALGIAGYDAGVGSFCFPSYDLIPVKKGYSTQKTTTHQSVSGQFLVNWEWSLGAPHVQLLLPD